MPEQQPTLSDMIRREVDNGVTYAELERRAIDPDTGIARISDSQINRYALGTATRMPTEEQVRGLAAALRRPYDEVREAALAQWLPAEHPDAEAALRQLRADAVLLQARLDAALDYIADIRGRRSPVRRREGA